MYADILLDCLRNHHSKIREQVHVQIEPTPIGRRLNHIVRGFVVNLLGVWKVLRLLFSWCL